VRLTISRRARRDLLEIWLTIAEHDEGTADRVLERIHAAIRRLGTHPDIGHQRDELGDASLRVWPVHSWLVVYRVRHGRLQVSRVVFGRRDLRQLD
jgi:plasmid stabilization system protein ParE